MSAGIVIETHDFTEEEGLHERETFESEPLPVRPFNKIERTSDYVFHLPESYEVGKVYPWDDRAWQGEWLWRRGGIGRAEAHFWFVAMTHPARHTDTRRAFQAPRELRRISALTHESFTLEEARGLLRDWFEQERRLRPRLHWFAYSYFARLLLELFPADEVFSLLVELVPGAELRHFFIHFHLPEEPEARARLERVTSHYLDTLSLEEGSSFYTAIRLLERVPNEAQAVRICQRLEGLSERPATLVRDMVNCLNEQENFARAFVQFEDYAIDQESIPFLMRRGGLEIAEPLFDRVLQKSDAELSTMIKDLLRIRSHRMTRGFLTLYHRSVFSAPAHGWMVEQAEQAIEGLVELIASRHKLSHVAQELLRELRDRGHAELIEARMAQHSAMTQEVVRRDVLDTEEVGLLEHMPHEELPRWLQEASILASRRGSLPPFVSVSELPPLEVEGASRVLSFFTVERLLLQIFAGEVDLELRDRLMAYLTAESRHRFIKHMIELWGLHEYDRNYYEILNVFSYLGAEQSVPMLAAFIEEWAKNGRHYGRIKRAISALTQHGSPAALTRVHHMAQRAKQSSVVAHAEQELDAYAEKIGVSRDDLEDRMVPDCELDERGQRRFSYGERAFTMTLDADLSPSVLLEDGTRRASLPPARKSDNAELVARAREAWKAMRAQLKDVLRVQRDRLEEAMICGRAWRAADFEAYIVAHPLMGNLARHLLWGRVREGEALACFRVSEERELLDREDQPLALDADDRVVVVHPMQLDEATRRAWGEVFADYELTPAFAQLARTMREPSEEELATGRVMRFSGKSANALKLKGILLNRRWRLGYDGERVSFKTFALHRFFPQQQVVVTLHLTGGVSARWDDNDDETELGVINFNVTQGAPAWGTRSQEVRARMMSEVIIHLEQVLDRQES